MKKGLGDQAEEIIEKLAPKFAQKKKDCVSCKKRKQFLNNFNALFS